MVPLPAPNTICSAAPDADLTVTANPASAESPYGASADGLRDVSPSGSGLAADGSTKDSILADESPAASFSTASVSAGASTGAASLQPPFPRTSFTNGDSGARRSMPAMSPSAHVITARSLQSSALRGTASSAAFAIVKTFLRPATLAYTSPPDAVGEPKMMRASSPPARSVTSARAPSARPKSANPSRRAASSSCVRMSPSGSSVTASTSLLTAAPSAGAP